MITIVELKRIEAKLGDRGSRLFKLAVISVFSCGQADEGAYFSMGLSGEGWTA